MVIFILPHFADPVCPFFAKIFARFFREFYKRKKAAPLVGDAAIFASSILLEQEERLAQGHGAAVGDGGDDVCVAEELDGGEGILADEVARIEVV